jgi:hypothetical protein
MSRSRNAACSPDGYRAKSSLSKRLTALPAPLLIRCTCLFCSRTCAGSSRDNEEGKAADSLKNESLRYPLLQRSTYQSHLILG